MTSSEYPILIAPSLLASDFSVFGAEAARAETAGGDWLHLDVMDGHFVDNISFGPAVVQAVRPHTKNPLDVHLMITRPDHYWPRFREAGADHITVHVEAEHDVAATLRAIRESGCGAGLALNPGTPFEAVTPFLGGIDLLLVMTVVPGFGGQSFMEETMTKVQMAVEARKCGAGKFHIEVDGGIQEETAKIARSHGANVFVAGTSVFRAPNMAEAIQKLRTP